MAIFMIKMAAQNWSQYGNILGTNEIMGLMFHRDVMVLGLSDGVMCGATGFGLILQKLIQRGWLSWNRTGWIIQSVSFKDLDIPSRTNTFSRSGNSSISLLSSSGHYFGNGLGRTLSFSYCMDSPCS